MPDLFQKSGALFSECGKYRYRLWRIWDDDRPIMCWVAQNPSVANDVDNDPTVRKMMGFAKRDGCGGIMLANVMAAIATQERELMNMVDPIGPANGEHLQALRSVAICTKLVVAWGNRFGPKKKSIFRTAYCNAANICVGQGALCLGVTKSGDPKHPLFVPYETKLVPWTPPGY
jgi:hypothetical protein